MDPWGSGGRGCLGLGAGALSSVGGFQWHSRGSVPAYLDAMEHDLPGITEGVWLTRSEQRLS